MSVVTQPGGMFNSYRAQYSPETHSLLKVLMEEAKLSSNIRREMKRSLDRGEPLPVIVRRRPRPSYVDNNLFDLKKNYYFSRRSKDQIVDSGAYEPDRYRFLDRIIDLEKEKERLSNIMVYGKNRKKGEGMEAKNKGDFKNDVKKEITPEERKQELVIEIEDRLEFLSEMEAFGKGKSYESVITQEIAAKIRELRKIDRATALQYSRLLKTPKKSATNIQQVLFHK